MSSSPSWLCPSCFKRCAYGTHGCGKPSECPEPKNNNHKHRLERDIQSNVNTQGVGISEITEGTNE